MKPKKSSTEKKRIILLGATGSIGSSTIKVLRNFPEEFQLVGISANTQTEALLEIAEEFKVPNIALTSPSSYKLGKIRNKERLILGNNALEELIEVTDADLVIVAIVGARALNPTLRAINKGMNIALANKELLVLGGSFVTEAVQKNRVQLLPIDSEHNAIFQCLQGYDPNNIKSIVLTASGGACRDLPLSSLSKVTPKEAQAHPNWSMGAKITIDSATMANKGLELIEARWLFDLKPEQLRVVIHPESTVHSFVEWIDGSVLAQLSPPDMTFAIQHCLFYPDKKENPTPSINFNKAFKCTFIPPDIKRYPCLDLAYQALKSEPFGGAIFNAANEIAVQRFLLGEIPFTNISKLIEKSLTNIKTPKELNLETLIELDSQTRDYALKQKIR